MTTLIQLDYDENELLDIARERGYDNIQTYLKALIDADEENLSVADELRIALREMNEGKGFPADRLWDDDED